MHAVARPGIQAARRVDGHDQARRGTSGQLPRGDELLLVAAGEVCRPRGWIRRANVEFSDQPLCHRATAAAIDEESLRVRRRRVVPEGKVLLDAEGATEREAPP